MAILLYLTALFLAHLSFVSAKQCKGEATYRLTFKYLWTKPRFSNVPGNAHFSPLVAFSHEYRYSAFSKYGYASTGFKNVAETGSTVAIKSELDEAKKNGLVKDIQIDGNVPDGDGSASVTLKIDCKYHYISAVSMVAPSPDWVAPIFRLSVLKKRNNKQRKRIKGFIKVWDAGTDSGETLTASDEPSNPAQNIAELKGAPFDGKDIAEFTLVKL